MPGGIGVSKGVREISYPIFHTANHHSVYLLSSFVGVDFVGVDSEQRRILFYFIQEVIKKLIVGPGGFFLIEVEMKNPIQDHFCLIEGISHKGFKLHG